MRRFSPPAWVSLPLCLATVNLLSNCAVETSNVFMALYAQSIGSSNLEVGFIAAAAGIAFLLSSLWFGRLSDTRGRMKFIRLGLGLSALAYVSQILADSPLTLMAARGFVGFSVGINSSVIMAYTYEHQKQIGNFVSYGALGWLIGAMVAAAVKSYHALFIISAAVSALAFLASFCLKEEATTRVQVTTFPLQLIKADYRIYLAFFLRQLGGTAIWTVWPLYLASIGATKLWIAVMDASNMVGQIVAMRFVERFNAVRMFQTGLIISTLVFAIYGAVARYLPLVFVQLFLAIGWSTLLIGALSYLLRRSQERGTAAGLLNSTISLSGSLGPFLGGAASQAWGYVSVMHLGTGISLLAFLSSLGLKTDKGAKTADVQPLHPHW
jgi:MFS family permease